MELAENSVETALSPGVIGRPFAPGVSGNPGAGQLPERHVPSLGAARIGVLGQTGPASTVNSYRAAADTRGRRWRPAMEAFWKR